LLLTWTVSRREQHGPVWWLAVLALPALAAAATNRLARRLLPLTALCKLALVFPDRAPSRMKIAMRSGTVRQLAQRVERARTEGLGTEAMDSAEYLLELVGALNIHDRRTRGHAERVRAFTDLLAEEMKLPADDRDKLHWAALLHDIGKIAVPQSILNKPGAPDDEEWEILKQHPLEGERIAAPLAGWLGEWATAIGQHHERWDGRGYPRQLAGTELSLAARIVCVADSFEVMTAARSYKRPIGATAARAELARCAGEQFDPAVVRAFMNISLGRLRWTLGPLTALAQLPIIPQFREAAQAGFMTATRTATMAVASTTLAVTTLAATGHIAVADASSTAPPPAPSTASTSTSAPTPVPPAPAVTTTSITTASSTTTNVAPTTVPVPVRPRAATTVPPPASTPTSAAPPPTTAAPPPTTVPASTSTIPLVTTTTSPPAAPPAAAPTTAPCAPKKDGKTPKDCKP
jgi:hypothetical protein